MAGLVPIRIHLALSLIVHFQVLSFFTWVGNFFIESTLHMVFITTGVALILYPLCGWVTEVYSYSLKVIKMSLIPLSMAPIVLIGAGFLLFNDLFTGTYFIALTSLGVVAIVSGVTGLGMFEANAIQFGMDQLIDAPSEQLSSFIHWYFWCINVGPLANFYLIISLILLDSALNFTCIDNRYISRYTNRMIGLITITNSCMRIVVVGIGVLLVVWSKRVLHVEPMSRNSLKLLYQVLKYSYHHKYPARRSSLSYWENGSPSRIDLGKDKYGGPFTYEQVEDVKTFFRLLLLMASLFGFFLLGDGFSLINFITKQNSCSSFYPFILIIINPQHFAQLTVLIGIPLFRCSRRVLLRYIPNLLSRLWIGLYVALIAVALQTLLSLYLIEDTTKHFNCPAWEWSEAPQVLECTIAHISNFFSPNCTYGCHNAVNPDNTVYVFIAPLILRGIAYLLVFMTMMEFICAQAPNSMKGLLIGLWYSMLSIKIMIVYNINIYLLDTISWYIYNLAKGVGIFVSIILFSLASKYYRYRERNEVVNYQNIIEEQYERELRINQTPSDQDDENNIDVSIDSSDNDTYYN